MIMHGRSVWGGGETEKAFAVVTATVLRDFSLIAVLVA